MTSPIDPNDPAQAAGAGGAGPADTPADAAAAADTAGAGPDTADDQVTDQTADTAADADQADSAGEAEPAHEPTTEELLAERTDDLQRMAAEYANFRKRQAATTQAAIERATANVLAQFLPIVDDLELAAQHGDVAEGPLKAFSDKFTQIMTGLKVTPFGETGDEFNPELHEAVQDLSEGEEKFVGPVLRKGYMVGDKLLRTAMVIIADPDNPDNPTENADA